MNSKIGSTLLALRWEPQNAEVPYELYIGQLDLGSLFTHIVPFDTHSDQVFSDIYHLKITETYIRV